MELVYKTFITDGDPLSDENISISQNWTDVSLKIFSLMVKIQTKAPYTVPAQIGQRDLFPAQHCFLRGFILMLETDVPRSSTFHNNDFVNVKCRLGGDIVIFYAIRHAVPSGFVQYFRVACCLHFSTFRRASMECTEYNLNRDQRIH